MNILASAVALSLLQCASQTPPPNPTPKPVDPPPAPASSITLSIPDTIGPSGMHIESTLLPAGDMLELVTVEAILERGRQDFGVFSIKPAKDDWKHDGSALSYQWKSPEGLELTFRAKPDGDSVELEYRLKNGTPDKLERLMIHPCLPTQGSNAFFPGDAAQAKLGAGGRAARTGKHDYTELWSRLWLWSKGKPFSFSESKLAKDEKHLSFMRKGEEPIEWNWWKNGELSFDLPLIAAESKDKQHVLALGFEKALWASSNGGDPRACMHLFPSFGKLAPGEERTVRGRLYILAGDAEAARKRFLADFPGVDK